MAIPRGGCLYRRRWRSWGIWEKIESPGNCHLRVPTRRYGYQNVQNFGANNFGFHPKVDILDFWVLFLKKVFPKIGKLATLGPMKAPWAPWAHGPHGPHGPQGSPGAPQGPPGPPGGP